MCYTDFGPYLHMRALIHFLFSQNVIFVGDNVISREDLRRCPRKCA